MGRERRLRRGCWTARLPLRAPGGRAWEGVLDIVPGPSGGHADVDASVLLATGPLARAAGLQVRTTSIGGADDHRIPDGMLVRTRGAGTRIDTTAVVVEVPSPGAAGRRERRDRARRPPGDHR